MRNKVVAMLATVLAGAGLGIGSGLVTAAPSHAGVTLSPLYNPEIQITDGDDSATIWIATQKDANGAEVTENGSVVNWVLSTQPLTVKGDDLLHTYRQGATPISTCSFVGANATTWEWKCLIAQNAAPPVESSTSTELRWNVALGGGADSVRVNVDQSVTVGTYSGGNKDIEVTSYSTDAYAFGGVYVQGGSGTDRIVASSASNIVQIFGGDGNDNLTIARNGNYVNTYRSYYYNDNGKLVYDTYNDYTTIDGGNGNDVLNANHGRDQSWGRNGADTIYERDGLGDKIDCGAADYAQDLVYKNSTDSLNHCSSGNDRTNL